MESKNQKKRHITEEVGSTRGTLKLPQPNPHPQRVGTDGVRTRDLRFTRPTPYHLATAPALEWRLGEPLSWRRSLALAPRARARAQRARPPGSAPSRCRRGGAPACARGCPAAHACPSRARAESAGFSLALQNWGDSSGARERAGRSPAFHSLGFESQLRQRDLATLDDRSRGLSFPSRVRHPRGGGKVADPWGRSTAALHGADAQQELLNECVRVSFLK